MPSCFIKHCDSGTKSQKIRDGFDRSFFKPSEEMLEVWSKAIGRSDKEMTKNHKVCELHFKEEDIERVFETKLSNQVTEKILRERPKLNQIAIPSFFLEENVNNPQICTPQITAKQVNEPQVPVLQEGGEIVKGFEEILKRSKNFPLPSDHWSVTSTADNIIWIRVIVDDIFSCRRVILGKDLEVKVSLENGKLINTKYVVEQIEDLLPVFQKVETLLQCAGANSTGSIKCEGYVFLKDKSKKGPQPKLCATCKKYRMKLRKQKWKSKKIKNRMRLQKKKVRNYYKSVNRRNRRLMLKINKIKRKTEILRDKCSAANEEVLEKTISSLPKKQQIAVRAYLQASKLKNTKNMRYTSEWIYECFLLRIKSKKAYNQLRRDKILTLPSPKTLSIYLKRIKSSYGYQSYIFKGLEMKTAFMPVEDRRGIFIKFNKLN